jgi:hypothetical protein
VYTEKILKLIYVIRKRNEKLALCTS